MMTKLEQAAQQALEALEFLRDGLCGPKHVPNAITSLRETLDAAPQPAAVVQEPVEWYQSMAELAAVYGEMCAINETPSKSQTTEQKERLKVLRAECVNIHYKRIALTASLAPQPARQPLTDKQIQDIWCSAKSEGNQHGPFWFARAIEKAHGIT